MSGRFDDQNAEMLNFMPQTSPFAVETGAETRYPVELPEKMTEFDHYLTPETGVRT